MNLIGALSAINKDNEPQLNHTGVDLIKISVMAQTDMMLVTFDECRLVYHSHTLDYFPVSYFLILASKNHEYLKYLTD